MSELNAEKKSILQLLGDEEIDFLIPDYQRPYAWTEEQCQTLWEDIFLFSFPGNNCDAFNKKEQYFLGAIVTYKNEKGTLEVIDGQQRLTTLMLLLRVFYEKFGKMEDSESKTLREQIARCIWKTDEFGQVKYSELKVDSEVATDSDKEEFLELLRHGKPKNEGGKNRYMCNYMFFQNKAEELTKDFSSYVTLFPNRILRNCILLPIEAKSQDTALRIFSTLNDRGLPLSDADIFKAQLYKYYGEKNQKDDFIKEWKNLEEITKEIFDSASPMDELFTRYMYFLRARNKEHATSIASLKKFYECDNYQILRKDEAMLNLKSLALFWESVFCQDRQLFSDEVLRKLFVLKYAPNGMWQNIVSVYFLKNKDSKGSLDNEKFNKFLSKITAFIFAYAVTNPGVDALRKPVYDELVNIAAGVDVTFFKHRFSERKVRSSFENYNFTNSRKITRSILTWYAFSFPEQQLLDTEEIFQIEHIYSKNRQEIEKGLTDKSNLESLGNKILLERRINIRASDYKFEDKKRYYQGKKTSNIYEIERIVNYDKFEEQEIMTRTSTILEKFYNFLRKEDLFITEELD